MRLHLLPQTFSICRLPAGTPIPDWVYHSAFFNICQTNEELSIVAESQHCPPEIQQDKEWRAIKVQGPLDFALTGILACLANSLAEAEISIFAVSTYDTDYLLVKANKLNQAHTVLVNAGHTFE